MVEPLSVDPALVAATQDRLGETREKRGETRPWGPMVKCDP